MRMGDKYMRDKPKNEEKLVKKSSKAGKKEELSMFTAKQSILDHDELGSALYRPKSESTRHAYEMILTFITNALGDQPRDVACGAADEILAVLKDDKYTDKERKEVVDSFLGELPEERFAVIVNLGKKITDFGA